MERHEQLIRRTGTMLKCTCSNLWREYFFLDKLFVVQVHGVNSVLICQDMAHSTQRILLADISDPANC